MNKSKYPDAQAYAKQVTPNVRGNLKPLVGQKSNLPSQLPNHLIRLCKWL